MSTVGVDVPVDYSFYSYVQQWELKFLVTIAFRATKMLSTIRTDIPVGLRAI